MTVRFNPLTYVVLGVGVAATWSLIALADERDDRGLPPVVWYLWAALPYAVLALTTHFLGRTPARQLVTFGGAVATAVVGVGLLYAGIVVDPDPMAALDIVLLPAYQLVFAVAVLLVVSVLTLRRPAPPART